MNDDELTKEESEELEKEYQRQIEEDRKDPFMRRLFEIWEEEGE